MKISLQWLNDYVDLTGKTPADLEHALTMIGFEVEDIHTTGLQPLPHVVVGEILEFAQHPNADKLSVCKVRVDEGEPRQIVCGAKNFKANDRVIVSLPGAVLPGNFEIKLSQLRGVESQGMMCSYRELGLGEDHAGIAILEDRPAIGTPVNALFGPNDTVFDIEITPNRPDALSHFGIARELAAYFKLALRYPEVRLNLGAAKPGKLVESVSVETPELCPHYRGYAVRGVKVTQSPAWLRERLTAVGLRPINNVVDITNYVLLELGQPLHAFDAAKIKDSVIQVRPARAGETMVTLDGKRRELDPSMLVIADGRRPLVVAGVMGSVDAEVEAATVDVFLEAAWFLPTAIRKTARRLVLSTDSSYRFERGVDPQGAEFAALRCLDLILQLAGGELLGPPLIAGEPPHTERTIELTTGYVRRVLGFDLSDAEMVTHLESLELDVAQDYASATEGQLLRVTIPSFRQDLDRPIDLVEEILRLHGTEKIPSAALRVPVILQQDAPVSEYLRRANASLVGAGFTEAIHYSLRPEDELRDWYGQTQASTLSLANPLASDASHLRVSLVPGLLDCARLNLARQNTPRRLFETGRVFQEVNGKVYELVSVGFVLLQPEDTAWKHREAPDAYSVLRVAADLLGLAGVAVDPAKFVAIEDENAFQKGHAATYGGFKMGFFARCGLLSPALTRRWDLPGLIYAGSVYFTPEFFNREPKRRRYQPFSAFPAARRDLALLVDATLSAGAARQDLEKAAKAVLKEFELESVESFDVYQGEGVPAGKKSLAFALRFRSAQRTLTDTEVNKAFTALQQKLVANPAYAIRG